MMVEKSSIVVVQKVESVLPSVSNTTPAVRSLSVFQTAEIRQLFAQARLALKVPPIEIRTAPAHKGFGRILIVVPRRVGTAPQRNLIKRRFKAIFYEQKLFEYKRDVLIFTAPGAAQLSFDVLKKYLHKAVTA